MMVVIPMRYTQAFTSVLFSAFLLGMTGCKGQNLSMDNVMNGAMGMVQPMSMTDAEVVQMAAKSTQELDAANKIAPAGSAYDVRLQNITQRINIPGYHFNFKVYQTNELNAFALPNGEVRVYSGLMDAMTDQELLFVIGHEVGHVVNRHSLQEFRVAAASSGIRSIAVSSTGTLGQIANGQLGELTEKFVNAQFSQSQEEQADDYGLVILKANGLSPKIGAAALRKLASARSTGLLTRMFSSHPDPESRAQRLEKAA